MSARICGYSGFTFSRDSEAWMSKTLIVKNQMILKAKTIDKVMRPILMGNAWSNIPHSRKKYSNKWEPSNIHIMILLVIDAIDHSQYRVEIYTL